MWLFGGAWRCSARCHTSGLHGDDLASRHRPGGHPTTLTSKWHFYHLARGRNGKPPSPQQQLHFNGGGTLSKYEGGMGSLQAHSSNCTSVEVEHCRNPGSQTRETHDRSASLAATPCQDCPLCGVSFDQQRGVPARFLTLIPTAF